MTIWPGQDNLTGTRGATQGPATAGNDLQQSRVQPQMAPHLRSRIHLPHDYQVRLLLGIFVLSPSCYWNRGINRST